MTLPARVWKRVRCVACGKAAVHALELLLPIPRAALTPVVVGFCAKHYRQAKRTPEWQRLPIVEAAALEPRGSG